MYLIPDLINHPTFPKFVTFYKNLLLHVYSSDKQITLLDCMPGSISPKVEQAAIEALDMGVCFQADTISCIDIESDAIARLKTMMARTNLQFNGIACNLTALPFDDQSFNIITINHPFDDLLYYLVEKNHPQLKVEYNLELSGESVANQAEVRNAMLGTIISQKDLYLNIVKNMLLSEPSRLLTDHGILVIMNYFTSNWKRYDQYLNESFSDKMYTLTHDFFEFVCSHAPGLKITTQSIPIDTKGLFSREDKIEYVVFGKPKSLLTL